MMHSIHISDIPPSETGSDEAEFTLPSPFDDVDNDDLSIETTDLIERPFDAHHSDSPPRHSTDLGFLFRLLR